MNYIKDLKFQFFGFQKFQNRPQHSGVNSKLVQFEAAAIECGSASGLSNRSESTPSTMTSLSTSVSLFRAHKKAGGFGPGFHSTRQTKVTKHPFSSQPRTMYNYGDLFALSCTTNDFLGYAPEITTPPSIYSAALPLPPPLVPSKLTINEFDSVHEALAALKSEVGYSSSSSYGSPTSLPNCYVQRPSFIQRSVSSHSLQKNGFHHPIFSSLEESRREILDLETGPMRKVFSTGDLQRINTVQHSRRSESPLSHENCGIEGMNKVGRYTAEERKERIERYRSKRNQRNFNKKIKYACRKTLADSRPRIRGRFARNEEMGESSQTQWSQMGGEEDEEESDVWNINFFDPFSVNLIP